MSPKQPTWPRAAISICLFSVLLLSACSSGYTRRSNTPDLALARKLHQEATAVYEENPEQAKELLKRAVAADPFFGPAHNNLGLLYLQNYQVPQAFDSLETARRLMPGNPSVYVNLGLLFTQARRFSDAMREYNEALRIQPDYLPAMKHKTWLQIHEESVDETTIPALEQIAIRTDDLRWREFAERRSLKLRARDLAMDAQDQQGPQRRQEVREQQEELKESEQVEQEDAPQVSPE